MFFSAELGTNEVQKESSEESMHFGNDTLDRLLDDKTQGENFVTLHQTEKTPEKSKEESTPRFVKKKFQKK